VAKLFFLLSGEHDDLPFSELKAILEAEGFDFRVLGKLDQVAVLDVDVSSVEVLRRRAAFTRVCALQLFRCRAEIRSILKSIRSFDFVRRLKEDESFVVRVRHVKEYSSEINGMLLEQRIGEAILEVGSKARVSLKKPSKTFFGVLTSDLFLLGEKLGEIRPKPFVERRPRKKPFFHPSAMQPKLVRCMVNLAEARVGDVVLDPFCGTGSTLIEAFLIGCRGLGFDVQRRMIDGTRKNLAFFGVDSEGLIVGDACCMPVCGVDCMVTDPPYGISSTTLKRAREELVQEVLRSAFSLLKSGKRICIAAPKTLKIADVGRTLGYKHLESHLVYVHRSLTREIAVFEKV
jgi:tRNA (guanine10-N2)-dimethyltransferase